MGDGFKKIKKRVRINGIIKSLLNGAAVASLVAAVLVLLDKRNIYKPELVLMASVIGGAALVTVLISFFSYRKSDKRIAFEIDRELKLDEKIQTMVEFKRESGNIIDVQRKDADERLKSAKKIKYQTRGRWVSVASFFIAACMLSASVTLIPQKVEAAEPEAEYTMSEYERMLLSNLIEYVERSSAVEKEKKNIVDSLKELQAFLSDTVKESEKKDKVVATILDANNAVKAVNYLEDISDYANEKKFTRVSRFADAILILRESSALGASMPEAFAAIDVCLSPIRGEFTGESSFEDMGNFMNEIKAVISGVKNANLAAANNNVLLDSLSAFCDEISEFCSGTKPQLSLIQEQFDIFFKGTPPYEESLAPVLEMLNVKKLYNALAQEKENLEVGKYVVNQLMSIFDIPAEMIPGEVEDLVQDSDEDKDNPDMEVEPTDPDDDQTISSGGIGDGDLVLGANDTIYYPEMEKYAPYGEAIAKYHDKILLMIENGQITDEKLIAYYEDYFDILYGSQKKD